jgi:iron complex outermembrane receptor protein
MDSRDTYYTSTDLVFVDGNLLTSAIYLQDEWKSKSGKLHINIGGRYDFISFRNGSFDIQEPSAVSSILVPYIGDYDPGNWSALSPKIGLRYSITQALSFFTSFSTGFRSPILDDMCRNGNITKGLKLANPELKPEKLQNFELGIDLKPGSKLKMNAAIFYSIGTDFQYFVGTGDSIFSGNQPKPVLKRENIGKVGIGGFEAGIDYKISSSLFFSINYGWYQSEILTFDVASFAGKDLTGKQLMEVAPNQLNSALLYKSKIADLGLYYHYTDRQFTDDENTIIVGSTNIFDMKISRDIGKQLNAGLNIQNLLNKRYIDEKGILNLGRFIMFDLSYSLH